jgi:hypothetical protein
MSFEPVPTRKHIAGWTAERQRAFIKELAASGSVSHAAAHVGMSVRSAYRLRGRAQAQDFDRAWHQAIWRAGSYLMAVAMERAVHGTRRELWKDGKLVATQIAPSDKLLMFSIDRLTPGVFSRTPTPEDIQKNTATFRDHEPDPEDMDQLPQSLAIKAEQEATPTP